jgi:hypothetical protein
MHCPSGLKTIPAGNKKEAGGVHRQHELAERQDRGEAISADRKRHGSQGGDRGKAHDDAYDAEHCLREEIKNLDQRHGLVTHACQCDAKEDGEEEDRKYLILCERIYSAIGNDVQEKFADGLRGSGGDVA